MSNNIYLDHAATTPISTKVKDYVLSIIDVFGNASSQYSTALPAKEIISDTRKCVANFINATPDTIFFTPSGSASNTLAISGYIKNHKCCVLYSPISHKSIINCVNDYRYSYPLIVDKCGAIDLEDLEIQLQQRSGNLGCLVVVDYANSEIGTIQDVVAIANLVHTHRGVLFLDCTGSVSTIPINVKELDADMIAFSGHKLGALKGCAVLYKRPHIRLTPLIYGNQEQGLIGGTENVIGIASLGKALEDYDYSSISTTCRDYIYDYIKTNIPGSYLVGSLEHRLAHNLYMCFKGVEGESLMMLLDLKGIQVSTGSACNSGNLAASTTLSAIGIDNEDIHSCIRLSFSGNETKDELDYVCKTMKDCVEQLRKMNER